MRLLVLVLMNEIGDAIVIDEPLTVQGSLVISPGTSLILNNSLAIEENVAIEGNGSIVISNPTKSVDINGIL